MGHAYVNYLSKAYNKSYRKMLKKEKNHRFIFWQNPVKVKKYPQKIKQISIPYLLQDQTALVLQLMAYYCGSTTCRRTDNCEDAYHTDS